ncbi:hypothetical protein [Pandoraea faecigallinarum]|uniref:hypothetical protein n=1 Tax=Pandoraea faecigallinarum TaxID=656179 RepID=UPI000A025987|nr:hypothetical protein [Pandoraea faecigallinarum]
MNEPRRLPLEIDSIRLVEHLAQSVADRISPALPLAIQLWNAKTIGSYLQRSPAVVLERVVTLPDFPTPIRLPSTRAKSKSDANSHVSGTMGQPLWKAIEVIAWVDSHRKTRGGRPRKLN